MAKASSNSVSRILITVFGMLVGCSLQSSASEQSLDWIQGFAKHTDKDNPIPRELAKKLEDDYKAATKDPKAEHEKPFVRHLLVVSTELTQSKPRALRAQAHILTPPGGGTVDLADYVTPLKGLFRLKITLENDHREVQFPSKVYFISQSKERKVDNETFGSGCGKYFDVTKFFNTSMTRNGFELYTADQRYVPVVRGTFVFVSYTPEALQLASVTFYDSRYTAWDCPQPEVL